MPARRVGIDDRLHLRPFAHHAAQQMALMHDQPTILLRIGDDKHKPVADQLPRVAHLAAAFAVERRAIEHHADRVLVADLLSSGRTNDRSAAARR